MNINKIISSITHASIKYRAETGREPSELYLSANIYKELKQDTEKIVGRPPKHDGYKTTCCGMKVFVVSDPDDRDFEKIEVK